MNSEVEDLRRRCELLEGQVIALSRAPALLSAVIKELQADNRALRIGAKRRFTEQQLRASGSWNTEVRARAGLDEPEAVPSVEDLTDVEEAS